MSTQQRPHFPMNERSLLLPNSIHSNKSYYTEADTAETDKIAVPPKTNTQTGSTTSSKDTGGDCVQDDSLSTPLSTSTSHWSWFMVLIRAAAIVLVSAAAAVTASAAFWATRISRRTLTRTTTTTPLLLSASFLPKSHSSRRHHSSHWKSNALSMSAESSNQAVNMKKGWLGDMSLSDFLRHSRDRLNAVAATASDKQHPNRLHFVIGNEAGDADSLVSALSWAFVENSHCNKFHGDDNDDPLVATSKWKIPLVSISRSDLETQRPETLLLLQLAGVAPTELLYIDDVHLQRVLEENDNDHDNTSTFTKVYLTLMDHNRLSTQSPFANNNPHTTTVLEIVDHHYDEGLYLDATTSDSLGGLRLVAFENGQALVASTCTMVVERIVDHWNDNILESNQHPDDDATKIAIIIPAPLSILLLGAILLDTINLNVAAGKVTDRDVAAVQVLLQHTDWTNLFDADANASNIKSSAAIQLDPINRQPDTTALFNALQNAKFAPSFWQSLSVRDALRLDYKRFAPTNNDDDDTNANGVDAAAFGISTVLMPWTDFYQKEAFEDGVRDFMQDMKVDLFGIMLAYVESDEIGGGGRLHRELVLASLELETSVVVSLDSMVDFLLTHDNNPLDLSEQRCSCQDSEPFEAKSGGNGSVRLAWRCFTQRNAKASRKQVAPAMLKYFDQS